MTSFSSKLYRNNITNTCTSVRFIFSYGMECKHLCAVKVNAIKPVQNDHSQKDQKLVFKTSYCLMQVKSIAECSKGSILQYFRPSLSCHLSDLCFGLFLSGRFTQVLLYFTSKEENRDYYHFD